MLTDTPRVIYVIAFFGHSFDHADVLQKPIPLGVVASTSSLAAIVIAAILKVNPNRLLLTLANDVRILVATSNISEASDGTKNFAELFRTFPCNGESRDSSGATAADPMIFCVA